MRSNLGTHSMDGATHHEWLMRLVSGSPGFRTGRTWKMIVAVIWYVPLLYLLVLAPALGALLLVVVALLFNGWGARTALEHRIRPLRSERRVAKALSWALFWFVLAILVAPIAILADYVAIPVAIGVLAWWLVWREDDAIWARAFRAVVICVATPVALAWWYWGRATGWIRLAVLAAIFGSLDTYGFLLLIWVSDKSFFGDGRYWLALDLILWILVAGCAFALSAILMFAARQAPVLPTEDAQATAAESGRVPASQRPWVMKYPRLAAAVSLLPRLGLWSAMQLLFVIPWILIVPRVHGGDYSLQVFLGVGISVLPLAVTSVIALLPEAGYDRSLTAWIERHLAAAGASAVLLSLALTVSFALENAQVVAENNSAMPFVAATAFLAGVSMSLSIRLGQRLQFRTNWTYAGTVTTIAFLSLATFVAIGYALDYNTPNTQQQLLSEAMEGAKYPLALLVFAFSGVVVGAWILDPGLRTFAGSLARVREMLLPLVGFVAGYVLIVLLFGAVYHAAYLSNPGMFACMQAQSAAESAAGAVQSVPCQQATVGPTETDFMYFSINTALPLGYSRIRPADDAHALQWATAGELIVATSWIVVVFAAMLHALQERMIQRTTEKEMKQLSLSVAQLGQTITAIGARIAEVASPDLAASQQQQRHK